VTAATNKPIFSSPLRCVASARMTSCVAGTVGQKFALDTASIREV
jgi:hypothetical protein